MKIFNIFNILKVINYLKNIVAYTFSIATKNLFLFGKPSFASFEISSFCNLNCPQCDVGNKLTNRKNKFLDLKDYYKIIDQIGPYLIDAIFYFQGEPLLNKDFDKYISYAKTYNIYAITSTNAQLINKNLAKKIIFSGLDKIIISIDGTTEDIYQKYRKGGSLNKTIEALNILKETKKEYKSKTPIIEAQFIVFKFNEHQIDEFKTKAISWGADSVAIKSAQICSPDKDYELIPDIKKYSRYKKVNDKWVIKKNNNFACFRAWSGMVISSDENVLPCCFDKQENYIYGNLKFNNDIVSIWKSERSKSFRKNLLNNRTDFDMCKNCNE